MPRIAVLGDAIIDRYLECEVTRISPEAPVPVYHITGSSIKSGGAGNVLKNVRQFFPDVVFLRQPMDHRVTRIVSGSHYLARFDEPAPDRYNSVDLEELEDISEFDAYIVSDYDKGYVTPELMSALRDTGKNIYMGGKNKCYPGLELFVLNHEESERVQLAEGVRNYVVTHAAAGAELRSHGERLAFMSTPRNVVDVTGAGDVFFAHLACHMILGTPIEEAIPLANDAAGKSVEVFGTCVIPPATPLLTAEALRSAV